MTRIHLLAIASLALVAACSGSNTSSTNQLISCQTDPETGVVLSCEPTDSSDDDSPHSCVDVDEDGDGEPSDDSTETPNPITRGGSGSSDDDDSDDDDGDSDDDGIPDSRDCDEHEGEDGDGGVDLPYDVKPALGSTTNPIFDAFAEKGAEPAAIVSVTMDGGDWRLAELTAGTAFVVTQADCDHEGNRDVGRDRIVVTWQNADGSEDSDHLDLRYCE